LRPDLAKPRLRSSTYSLKIFIVIQTLLLWR